MRALFFVGAGLLLAFQESFGALPGIVASLVLVAFGSTAAIGASERLSPLAIGFGALGVFLSNIVVETSPSLAGAVLVLALYLERSLRARSPKERILHLGLALALGALSGFLASEFRNHAIATRIVVAVVVATLAGLPLFLPVRDRIGEVLARGKAKLPAPFGPRLGRLLDLYELGNEITLEKELASASAGAFSALADLVEQRLDLERVLKGRTKQWTTMTTLIDRNIERHADLLERAYSASTEPSVASNNESVNVPADVAAVAVPVAPVDSETSPTASTASPIAAGTAAPAPSANLPS